MSLANGLRGGLPKKSRYGPPLSQTGPTPQMSRAFLCELMYSAWLTASSIRLRGIRPNISFMASGVVARLCSKTISPASFKMQYELESRKMQTIGELVRSCKALLPSSGWC